MKMEDFHRPGAEVRKKTAEKSKSSVMMNLYEVSVDEKPTEMMTKDVSIKGLKNEVMKLGCKNVEVKRMVRRLQFLNQNFLKKMGDSNKSCGKYVKRMIRNFPKNNLGIGLAVT